MQVETIILAGGTGSRLKADKPKQFIEVNGVPIIVNTIKNFQNNDRITGITIVCIDSWVDYLQSIIEQYRLTKVDNIVLGGATGHDSARNGVFSLAGKLRDDDYAVITDAARPLIPQAIINDMLDTAFRSGNACTAIACRDTVIVTDDQVSGDTQIDRSRIMRVQTPQAYRYDLIRNLYKKAEADNMHNFIYANTMAVYYGERIYFSAGFDCNIKITAPEDIAFYKALLQFDESALVK